MSTAPANTIPATTSTVVPVTCVACGEDMTFIVTYSDSAHRRWTFDCTHCGRREEAQDQRRHEVWAHCSWDKDDTTFIGSYWGPDV